MPVYCYELNDMKGYRYVLATLVNHNFCSIIECSNALGVIRKNIERYAKDLRDKVMSHFFNRYETRGLCYKFTPVMMNQAQCRLDQG